MTQFSLSPWQQLSDRTWLAVAEPDSVNIGLVAGDEGCVLIDCGSTPAQGRQIRQAVAEVTDRPLRGVIVTHAHRDHWFGLAAFDDLDSWGHEGLAEAREDAALLADAADLGVAAEELRVPSRPLSLVAGIDLGNQWIEALHVGPGHSPHDVIVVVGAEQLVFAGDVVEGTPDSQNRPAPEYGPDSQAEPWSLAVDAVVSAMTKPGWRAVPGHGPLLDKEEVSWQRGLHAVVHGETHRLGREGVGVDEAAEAGHWPWDYERVRAYVERELPTLRRRRQLPLGPV
ncbi:MBL fold metallo-hydrolase [Enemella sp. A6]|uniref:MBL fold metallo-hydrolase n=1 Tax=Enemella sp. A6 TaxID=3440152 RepID=UPI003EBEEFC6